MRLIDLIPRQELYSRLFQNSYCILMNGLFRSRGLVRVFVVVFISLGVELLSAVLRVAFSVAMLLCLLFPSSDSVIRSFWAPCQVQ